MRTRIIVAGLLCLLAPVCSPVAAQQLLFTAIDVQPAAINDMAETVGSFRTPGLTGDCFDPGTCSSAPSDFCVAGAAPNPPLAVAFCGPVVDGTFCISSDGWIVGSCVYDPVGKDHGFLRSADGSSLTTIDLPRAAGVFNFTGINDAGQIVGGFADAAGGHGFRLDPDGGFTAIDVPGAVAGSTEAYGINATGQIVGTFLDTTGVHGFRLDTDGSFRTLDARGATGSEAFGINAIGEIVGRFQDVRGIHGFLQTTDGGFTVIDAPAATRTEARAINATGQIVGVFTDASGTSHGFLLSGGAFTTIDVPGAMAGSTTASGINNAGLVVGSFADVSTGKPQGFIGVPFVTRLPTTTTVAPSANPVPVGLEVTFTASVGVTESVTPRMIGMVTFLDGTQSLGTSPLNALGQATLATRGLAVGTHTITARYLENGEFGGSTSPPVSETVFKPTTTTTLTSSSNPAKVGQAVIFTARVGGLAAGAPAGTVTFLDGATALGTVALNAQRTATWRTTTLAAGAHAVTAYYGGDPSSSPNLSAGISPVLTETITKAATTTSLLIPQNPAGLGQPVDLTATVTVVAPGTGRPTGPVTFLDGATVLGSDMLIAGSARLQTSALSVGPHRLTAHYQGDPNFGASTSPPVTETISKAATTATLASSPTSAVAGEAVTFTATVSGAAPGTGTATGRVTFLNGTTALGTASLNTAGKATVTTATLSVGPHTITARYAGDPIFGRSLSVPLRETIDKAPTTTTVASSTTSPVMGQAVAFTATVSVPPPGAGTPTGAVTFFDGATVLGTATLNAARSATLTTSTLSVGDHAITARYGGTPRLGPSRSTVLAQTIGKAATRTAVTSPTPSAGMGRAVTFTATVSVVAPGAGTPSGPVTFLDGATPLGTTMLDAARQATLTTRGLPVGGHTITAAYAGTAKLDGSTSAPLTETIGKAASRTTLTSSKTPAAAGGAVTFTATVSVTAPGAATPTGEVTFFDGTSVLVGTATLDPARRAALTTSGLSVGRHTITADYGGDANVNGSISPALTETIGQLPAAITGR